MFETGYFIPVTAGLRLGLAGVIGISDGGVFMGYGFGLLLEPERRLAL